MRLLDVERKNVVSIEVKLTLKHNNLTHMVTNSYSLHPTIQTKDNMVMVFGEISTAANLDYEKIVRDQVREIGFSSFVDDLSSVDSKGLSCDTCEVLVRINKQSPDIAGGVHVGKDDMDVGAGDQGIMFGYASDETECCMPLTHLLANKLGKQLTDVRKDGKEISLLLFVHLDVHTLHSSLPLQDLSGGCVLMARPRSLLPTIS